MSTEKIRLAGLLQEILFETRYANIIEMRIFSQRTAS